MSSQIDGRRIARNTAFMYFRMIIVMLVSLFTSRVILQTLGVEDFGIYNMVGGIVAMFQILSNTLSDATQRYITYEIGKGEDGDLNKIFSICVLLHIILGVIVIFIAEPIGLWFLRQKLLIPSDRLVASEWIFHFSVISMFVMFISIPYNALIIAYERMKAFAVISIFDVIIKLIIAYSLMLSVQIDRLILYGLLLLLLQITIRFIYTRYSIKHFKEARLRWRWDPDQIKEIGKFASWIIIGNTAYMGINQGINLLLGMFFLPAVNAARGIAVQVENAVKMFTRNFQIAMNPQITKSYAAGDVNEMNNMVFIGARLSFFLLQLPTLPILFETETILHLWLTEVPPYTAVFIRLILIIAWINSLGNTLSVAAKATGDIKLFEMCVVSIRLIVLPISYVFLRYGFSPIVVFIVYLTAEIGVQVSNVYVTHILTNFSLKSYLIQVLYPAIVVAVFSVIPLFVVHCLISEATLMRFMLTCYIGISNTLILVYFLGLTDQERSIVKSKIRNIKILRK